MAKQKNTSNSKGENDILDKVPEKGKGGLRKSILAATLLPLLLVAIILVGASSVIYTKALQKEVSTNLSNVAKSVMLYYERVYPGDYNLLMDNEKSITYLKKGEYVISDDTEFISQMSADTDTEISIFFYDTRLMTTIVDQKGKNVRNTRANSNIVEQVLDRKESYFFENIEIAGVRYCAEYVPVFSANGTCIGMVGVAREYSTITHQVNNLLFINALIMLLAVIFIGFCMVKYMDGIVNSLMLEREFLSEIAKGKLDGELSTQVLKREDEIGDMGRLSLYLRSSLKRLVEKDPLTNLNNRRSGKLKIDQTRARAERTAVPYSIAMGDIDFFKKVNDVYGHDAGDVVLKTVAKILSTHMMGHGTVIRWGGEEFLFTFDRENEQDAALVLAGMLDEIRDTVVNYDNQEIRFTMSYGIVTGDVERSAEQDINMADERLYFAKNNGRNRIVTAKEYVIPATDNQNEADEEKEMTDKNEERWDIYDKNKQLTGRTMKRNDWTLADDEYHLTVLGVVVNKEGKYLITKRVMTKSWAPGWWEVSGGGAMAGETSLQAVCREVKEETGLDVSNAEGGYVFTYHRENPGEGDNYFVDVYRFVLDFDEADLKLQEEETDGYMLASAQEVAAFGEEGIFLHYSSIKQVFEG